jgi:hypothetical protein
MFTLTITLGNDAMQTPEDVAAALETIAVQLRTGIDTKVILDANGNKIGTWTFDPTETE